MRQAIPAKVRAWIRLALAGVSKFNVTSLLYKVLFFVAIVDFQYFY